MLRPLAFAPLFLCLPACFLSQSEPKTGGTKSVHGIVTVEDLRAGKETEAVASGLFVRKSASRQVVGRAGRLAALAGSVATAADVDKSTPKCEVKTGPASKNANASNARRVSVGRVLFGPQGLELEQDDRLQYRKNVEVGLPAGIYPVVAEGSEEGHGFSGEVSLPEPLVDVKLNGTFVTEPATILRKKDNLVLSWRSVPQGADQNLILINILVQNDKLAAALHCTAVESNLATKEGNVEWVIAPTYLVDFPEEVTARIFILRAQVKMLRSNDADVQFQGIRTSYSMADVQP